MADRAMRVAVGDQRQASLGAHSWVIKAEFRYRPEQQGEAPSMLLHSVVLDANDLTYVSPPTCTHCGVVRGSAEADRPCLP